MQLKTHLLLAVLSLGLFSSCAKISSFDEPYAQETFTGMLQIDLIVKDLWPGAVTPGILIINGNKGGRYVTIAGIPSTDFFYVIPEKLLPEGFDPTNPPPVVSGLRAEVVDKTKLRVIGFSRLNRAARDLDLEVTGEFIREGPRLATIEPIVIKARARPLKAFLSSINPALMSVLVTDDKKALSEIGDNEMFPLYRLTYRGDVISVL